MKRKLISQLIEKHFEKDLIQNNYKPKTINAQELLTSNRFDLAFKLLYIENKDKKVKFAEEIYKEHIRAFSLGKYTEPGKLEKDSFKKFVEEFQNIFEDIKTNGFDCSKTLIPLSKNNSIANGAHRVACAIHLGKAVECVQIDTQDSEYNYKFFYERNVSKKILDIVATKFIENAKSIYIAFLWPRAEGQDQKIEELIPNIVYRKNIKLTQNGAHNILSQIYYGEKWLGDIENDFRGSAGKIAECFNSSKPLRVVVFQAMNLDEVLAVKEKIRNIFNIGKHSIHITDTKKEATRISKIIFNDNSIHFLNYAKPNKYMSTHIKIGKFKNFVKQNRLNKNDVLIDSSLILSCYGLREAKDIDFFCSEENKIKIRLKDINIHNEALKYYQETKQDLIYNPDNYFYFNNFKFVSFDKIYKMKSNRAEEKDRNDCKMMEALIENNYFKGAINNLKQKFYYFQIWTKNRLIELLKKYKLFKLVRKIYGLIK